MLFKSWLCEMNQTFDSDLSVCVCAAFKYCGSY